MTEIETLAKAYFVLGLEAGASLETINTRWKRLAMVWHSDRFPTAEGKKDADEELKKINDARDKLKAHFASNHKPNGPCACNGNTVKSSTGRSGTGQGPGPGKRRTTQESDQEEAEAQRRNAERARRTAEAAADQERRNAEAHRAAAAQQSAQEAMDQAGKMQEERLRWKIAICIGIAWLGLSLFGFIGMGLRHWWHDVSFHLQQMFPAHSDSDTSGSSATSPSTTSANTAAAQQQQKQQQQEDFAQNKRDAEEQDRKNQSIASAKLAIDQQQKIMDHCNSEQTRIQAQLADPNVANSTKINLRSCQMENQRFLSQAQADYNIAQQQLTDLTGSPPHISPYEPNPVPGGNSNKLWQDPFAKVQPELAPVQRFSGPDTQNGTERTP